MLTTTKVLLRVAPKTLLRRFPTALVARGFSAPPPTTDEIPKTGYDKEGHLISDHLEFLDRQIERTVEMMEENLVTLRETYQTKREHLEQYTQLDPVMWPLLDKAYLQKEELSKNITNLKQHLKELRATRSNFAVEAPDGESDGHILEEMTQVEHILEDIGKPQPKKAHVPEGFAVDGPDGESDAQVLSDQKDAFEQTEEISKTEDAEEINKLHAKQAEILGKLIAVDGPDGESDAQLLRDQMDADQQIDEMSKTEDAAKINKLHANQAEVYKERARDPEHDW